MTTPQSPSWVPSRRVLGNLPPKSINTPTTPTTPFKASEHTRAQSPLKQFTTPAITPSIEKENLVGIYASSKGKKRGIEEVDSAESVETSKMLARGRDETFGSTDLRLTMDAIQRHTQNNPIGLADPGSPTERNTPTPEPEPMPDSQKSNQSFSDLLNFELCASQKSDQGTLLAPLLTSVPAVVEERKSRADQLRTRLKFGLYKVKTNQVSRRDADIISTFEANASYSSNALNASGSTAMTSSAESIGSHFVPNITVSSPRHMQGPVFVKANLDPFQPIGKLGAPPVYFFPPPDGTSASSNMIHSYDLSSSPPGADLPQSVSPSQLMTPVRKNYSYTTPTMQRMRPGALGEMDTVAKQTTAHQRLQHLKEQIYQEGDLTSSAVKGNAAEGLMELKHCGR